ncbi:YadA-like family protein [Bartonella sp. DGB2]|uniref:YadA-like family protein n=1 Tax=Bartonella sp. DGB2 TaxID=3388426 RepID=UPI00398FEF1D
MKNLDPQFMPFKVNYAKSPSTGRRFFSCAVSLVSIGAFLLSSTAFVSAGNFSWAGGQNRSADGMKSGADSNASFGGVSISGDAVNCGVDNVEGRGFYGNDPRFKNQQISAEDEYERFLNNPDIKGFHPYGSSDSQVDGIAKETTKAGEKTHGETTNQVGHQGQLTGGFDNAQPRATGTFSFAFGCGAYAAGNNSIAFGSDATAKEGGAVALGHGALAGGKVSTALGLLSEATGQASTAVGAHASATAEETLALGAQSVASVVGGIALGANSVSNRSAGASGYDSFTGGVSTEGDSVWRGSRGALSVGDGKNISRQITGVAAGSEDGDAVNVAQLKALRRFVDQGWTVTVNGENQSKVGVGNTLDFKAGSSNLLVRKAVGSNDISFDLAQDLVVISVKTGAATLNNDGLTLAGGPRILLTGIDAGNKKVIDVLAGVIAAGSSDAVNGGQIFDLGSALAGALGGGASFENGVFKGPTYTVSLIGSDGTTTQTTYSDISKALSGLGDTVVNVSNQFDAKINAVRDQLSQGSLVWNDGENVYDARHGTGDQRVNSKIKYLADGVIAAGSSDAVNGGQIFDLGSALAGALGGGASFENGVFKGPTYTVSLIGSDGTTTQTTYSDISKALSGLGDTVVNVSNQFDAKINAVRDQLSQGSLVWNDGENVYDARHGTGDQRVNSKIKYLADGVIAEDSSDAVNGGQIFDLGSALAGALGGGASFENGVFKGPTYTVSLIGSDGTTTQTTYSDISKALSGLGDTVVNVSNQFDAKINAVRDQLSQGSLVWNDGENVYDARHGTGDQRVNSKIKYLADGDIAEDSSDAVTGSQLYKLTERLSEILGGGADLINDLEPDFQIQGEMYETVSATFNAIDDIFNDFHKKVDLIVADVDRLTNDAIVQQNPASKVITIGAGLGGEEVSVANNAGEGRVISGVKAAIRADEAVNLGQLDGRLAEISDDISKTHAAAVLYDKDEAGNFNYNKVTLGGAKTQGPVSLGNVAKGLLAENSLDAVNGGQVYEIGQTIAEALGGGAKFENGALHGPSYTLSLLDEGTWDTKESSYANVGDALKGLNENVDGRLKDLHGYVQKAVDGLNSSGMFWSEGEKAFLAQHTDEDGTKKNGKIKYLVDGDVSKASTEAVTGGQIYDFNQYLAQFLGGGAAFNNGTWSAPNYGVNYVGEDGKVTHNQHHSVGGVFNDMDDSINHVNSRVDQLKQDVDDINSKIDNAQNGALKWNEEEGSYDARHDGEDGKISHLADGSIEKGSHDAVNGGQVWDLNKQVNDRIDHTNKRVDNLENEIGGLANGGAVTYDKDDKGEKTNKITLAGKDPGDPVVLDNVGDGEIKSGSHQAVNGGQLYDYVEKYFDEHVKEYIDQQLDHMGGGSSDRAVERANEYTDTKFAEMTYKVDEVRNEARQAAAIGLAVANLRYNDTPGRFSVGVGSGYWQSQTAMAFGAGYTSETGKIRSNLSVTTSGGAWGVGAGISFTLN